MTEEKLEEAVKSTGSDRRSSIRVKSRLPCAIAPIDVEEIPSLEAQILDLAVIESEGVMHDSVDWRDHAEDLSREMVYVLNEVRALRQQITEVQRVIERYGQTSLQRRWLELNEKGLWLPGEETDHAWTLGEYASIRMRIPSIHTPEVLALGEVLRLDVEEGREGVVFGFRSISQPHKRAISSYALRRERQLARSVRFSFDS